jgi:hypothetical protein
MANEERQSEQATQSALIYTTPAELAAIGKKSMEEFVDAQKDLFDDLMRTNWKWIDRFQSETQLASEFFAKVAAARTIPDALSICQEWTSRRIGMMVDDGEQFTADTRKFLERGAHLVPNPAEHLGSSS